LVGFINQLTAKKIDQANVVKLDVRDYEEKVQAIEAVYKRALNLLEEQVKSLQRERHREASPDGLLDVAPGIPGAIAGAFVGFAVGGPIGAAAGAMIGEPIANRGNCEIM